LHSCYAVWDAVVTQPPAGGYTIIDNTVLLKLLLQLLLKEALTVATAGVALLNVPPDVVLLNVVVLHFKRCLFPLRFDILARTVTVIRFPLRCVTKVYL
jgi:hypothetical protein